MTSSARGVPRADHLLGAALGVAYVALLLATASDLGLSRDESMYVTAAESYARWFELLAGDPAAALQRARIDRLWRVNHEHPALVKSLFALSYLADRELGIFPRASLAFRFPGMLCAGLLLWLIHVFGTRLHGRRVGLFAALSYALIPRGFYHAHLDAFDVPITLAATAVAYAYLRSLQERRWAIGCGLLFGLALATKHNSWVLPGIFAIHFAIIIGLDRRRARLHGARPALSAVPRWLIAMALLGPPIFVGTWPWLWNATFARARWYAAFHLNHDYYNIAYFGENHFWPPFPVSFPWVMTLYTVPVTTLLLAVVGVTLEARRELSAVFNPAPEDPRHPAVLLLGCMLAPLVIISLPSTPIFGGTKHWLTAYPFMCLFAGVGFDAAVQVYARILPRALSAVRSVVAPVSAALLLLPAAVETVHAHPYALSHYGFAAGFVPGAADRGMNRQFWGFTTGSLADFFYHALPEGGSVYVCDTTAGAFRMLARDGLLPDAIVPTASIAQADYAIVHHEHHFAEVDHQIWTLYGTTRPVHVLTYDGVPLISVYANPRSKRSVHARGDGP